MKSMMTNMNKRSIKAQTQLVLDNIAVLSLWASELLAYKMAVASELSPEMASLRTKAEDMWSETLKIVDINIIPRSLRDALKEVGIGESKPSSEWDKLKQVAKASKGKITILMNGKEINKD